MKHLLIALFFLSATAVIAQTGDIIDKVVAVVGNETILYSEIEGQSFQMTQGQRPTDEVRCAALSNLLFQKLLVNQGKIDSIEVSDIEVSSRIDMRLAQFIQMLGSEEAFVEYYGKSIAEWREEFQDDMREMLLAEKAKREVTDGVDVTPAEVQAAFNAIHPDSLPLMGEQVHYRKILIETDIPEAQEQATIHFLDSIRNMLVEGKSSMTVQAAKWSEDPGSKFKGGCYPMQQKGSFVPEYEEAVELTPIGKYSNVFKTKFGYHFVFVKDKRGNLYESCHILVSAKMTPEDLIRTQAQLDSISTMVTNKDMTFVEAVSKYSTDEETRNQDGRVINPMTGGTGHELSDLTDPKLFLALNELEPGQVSGPIEFTRPDGTTVWGIVQLEKRVAAHRANLKDDYLIFKNYAMRDKQDKILGNWIEKNLDGTYVRIDEQYQGCDLIYDWVKNAEDSSSK